MELRQLGNSDLLISPIAIGAWAIGGGGWAGSMGSQNDRFHPRHSRCFRPRHELDLPAARRALMCSPSVSWSGTKEAGLAHR